MSGSRIYVCIFCLFYLTCFLNLDCLGQEEAQPINKQVWLDYNPKMKLGERTDFNLPIGVRTIYPNAWNRFYINPFVSYDWPRMILNNLRYKEQILGGVGFYYTYNINDPNRLEIRPWQGYSISAPNRERFVLKHYLRLEERFEIETDDWVNTFGLRFRYTASATKSFQPNFFNI